MSTQQLRDQTPWASLNGSNDVRETLTPVYASLDETLVLAATVRRSLFVSVLTSDTSVPAQPATDTENTIRIAYNKLFYDGCTKANLKAWLEDSKTEHIIAPESSGNVRIWTSTESETPEAVAEILIANEQNKWGASNDSQSMIVVLASHPKGGAKFRLLSERLDDESGSVLSAAELALKAEYDSPSEREFIAHDIDEWLDYCKTLRLLREQLNTITHIQTLASERAMEEVKTELLASDWFTKR